ncbi:MAG TPA: hypothetical protein VF939_06505 [Puia sp.]
MRKTATPYFNLVLLAVPFLFSGCVYHSYFQSPFYGNSETYHVLPLKSDSVPSATYVSGVFTEGGANYQLRDNVFSFTGSIYRSHNFGHFQGFYGSNVSLGSYNVGHYSYYNDARPSRLSDSLPINARAGDRFFGGYGAGGGVNFVLPFGRGSEWRVVGVSFALQKEFGDYWRFRKGLQDSLADVIFHNNLTGVLGFSTEFVFRTRHSVIGYKLMLAGDIINDGKGRYKGYDTTYQSVPFFQQSLSFTRDRFTGSFQFNVGNHVVNAQLGMGYRLGRNKRYTR